jgi:hypothetical protein
VVTRDSTASGAGAIAAARSAIGVVPDGKPTPDRGFGDPLRAVRFTPVL